jgi:hypothetical protein
MGTSGSNQLIVAAAVARRVVTTPTLRAWGRVATTLTKGQIMPVMRVVLKSGDVRDVSVDGTLRDKSDVEVVAKKAVLAIDAKMSDVRDVHVKPRDE